MKKLTMSTQTFANVTGINYPKVLLMVKKRLNLDSFPTISEVTHQHNDHETYDANKITYHLTRFHCHSMVMNLSKTISEAVFTKFDEFEDLAKRDFDANLASLSTKRLAVLASDDVMTMSTLEIADVTSKMHKDVLDDARDMFEGLGIASAEFTADVFDSRNRGLEVYNLPFNLTLLLVTGYDLTLRKRVIDEWIKLEKIVRELTPKLPDLQQEIMPTTTRDIAKYLGLKEHVVFMAAKDMLIGLKLPYQPFVRVYNVGKRKQLEMVLTREVGDKLVKYMEKGDASLKAFSKSKRLSTRDIAHATGRSNAAIKQHIDNLKGVKYSEATFERGLQGTKVYIEYLVPNEVGVDIINLYAMRDIGVLRRQQAVITKKRAVIEARRVIREARRAQLEKEAAERQRVVSLAIEAETEAMEKAAAAEAEKAAEKALKLQIAAEDKRIYTGIEIIAALNQVDTKLNGGLVRNMLVAGFSIHGYSHKTMECFMVGRQHDQKKFEAAANILGCKALVIMLTPNT